MAVGVEDAVTAFVVVDALGDEAEDDEFVPASEPPLLQPASVTARHSTAAAVPRWRRCPAPVVMR